MAGTCTHLLYDYHYSHVHCKPVKQWAYVIETLKGKYGIHSSCLKIVIAVYDKELNHVDFCQGQAIF
jgi:hypothetical protein